MIRVAERPPYSDLRGNEDPRPTFGHRGEAIFEDRLAGHAAVKIRVIEECDSGF
jgi:hypothetical protein